MRLSPHVILVLGALGLCSVSGCGVPCSTSSVECCVRGSCGCVDTLGTWAGCDAPCGVKANPRFAAPYGYGIIDPTPNPAVAGEPVFIDVVVGNDGSNDATGVELKLSYNDWSIGFGGWTEIETKFVDIANGTATSLLVPFTHTFTSAVHTCLEAKIVSVETGGDTNPNDNRAQINLEVVMCDAAECSFGVPVVNNHDAPIVVGNFVVGCKPREHPDGAAAESALVPCEFDVEVDVPGLRDDGTLLLPAQSEVLARLSATFASGSLSSGAAVRDVFVEAADLTSGSAGEANHVLVRMVPMAVADMLSFPLCCVKRVRTRVLLERSIAQTLDALDAGDWRLAVRLLRGLLQRVELLACDLSPDEKACLERLGLVLAQALRIILEQNLPSVEPTDAALDALDAGELFSRNGLYQAAVHAFGAAGNTVFGVQARGAGGEYGTAEHSAADLHRPETTLLSAGTPVGGEDADADTARRVSYVDVYPHGGCGCGSGGGRAGGTLYPPGASEYGARLDSDDDGDSVPTENDAEYGTALHHSGELHRPETALLAWGAAGGGSGVGGGECRPALPEGIDLWYGGEHGTVRPSSSGGGVYEPEMEYAERGGGGGGALYSSQVRHKGLWTRPGPLRLAIREGGRTVGAGQVTEILE